MIVRLKNGLMARYASILFARHDKNWYLLCLRDGLKEAMSAVEIDDAADTIRLDMVESIEDEKTGQVFPVEVK